MKYTLFTLIDITETGAHHGPDHLKVSQQANYNTVIQSIGLRANPTPIYCKKHTTPLKGLGFGNSFKGEHNYWEMHFEIEYGEPTIEMFQEDFDLVPIITGLTENAKIAPAVFSTRDSRKRNIVFRITGE